MSVASKQVVRRRLTGVMAAFLLGVVSVNAIGHSNEYLATIKGDHGGQVRMAEMYHFEVVVADGRMTVWVTDHGGNAMPTDGANASAVLINRDGKIELHLLPAGGNVLSVENSRIVADANGRIALTVTMKDQKALQVRYAPASDAEANHDHQHDHTH